MPGLHIRKKIEKMKKHWYSDKTDWCWPSEFLRVIHIITKLLIGSNNRGQVFQCTNMPLLFITRTDFSMERITLGNCEKKE